MPTEIDFDLAGMNVRNGAIAALGDRQQSADSVEKVGLPKPLE